MKVPSEGLACPGCGYVHEGPCIVEIPVRARMPNTDPQRAAAAALDAGAAHVGPARVVVLVTSLSDPYGVELGSDVPVQLAVSMLEMALLKIRRSL